MLPGAQLVAAKNCQLASFSDKDFCASRSLPVHDCMVVEPPCVTVSLWRFTYHNNVSPTTTSPPAQGDRQRHTIHQTDAVPIWYNAATVARRQHCICQHVFGWQLQMIHLGRAAIQAQPTQGRSTPPPPWRNLWTSTPSKVTCRLEVLADKTRPEEGD